MTALSSHQSQVFEELNLSYNSVSDQGVEYIAEYISKYECRDDSVAPVFIKVLFLTTSIVDVGS